jgi:electron transfer flavoprotein beta subunit
VEGWVCVKHVPESETRLRVDPSGRRYDPQGVHFTINNTYDEAAVEEALRLRESGALSKLSILSVGPARSEEGIRYALSMGADEGLLVETPPGEELDPLSSARVLAAALHPEPHDLVLVGRQAADDEAGIVGSALGEFLGLPSYAFVTGLELEAATGALKLRRYVEGGEEAFTAKAPAVISLLKGQKDPRTPTLPNILKARRKPLRKRPLSELVTGMEPGLRSSTALKFQLPTPKAGARIVDGATPEEAAEKLARLLREEAKVL